MRTNGLRCWLQLAAVAALLTLTGCQGSGNSTELLNVSYDPTRELYRDINEQFIAHYQQETGTRLTIRQSHGGSGTQARAVIDGLEADVATLAIPADTGAIAKKGLIAEDWQQRLPNEALPYYSTIVFVVRQGNPKNIKDWPDLVQDGVQIITPSPKTSGNGKLSYLAAWGYVISQGQSESAARDFVTKLYARVPVLDSGARGSTVTFAQKKIGDVHLTWENEAHLEVQESGGALQIVYPSVSIRAEPKVAVVDGTVDRRGTRAAAEAYLQFLYTDQAQELFAKHFYRPIKADVLKQHEATLPPMKMFPVTTIARDWDDALHQHFAEGGIFDAIYQPQR